MFARAVRANEVLFGRDSPPGVESLTSLGLALLELVGGCCEAIICAIYSVAQVRVSAVNRVRVPSYRACVCARGRFGRR